jgi:acetylornithine deacetylase/succinyl-diaminopimelate desuccinylase-like protein
MVFVRALLCSFVFLASLPAQTPQIDWKKLEPEILEHFVQLLKLDTTNPPGNETRVADYLAKVFQDAGIESKQFALEPSRANIVARLKGNGSRKPILLLAHSDVVGVQKDKWTVEPFAAVRKPPFIYGRGAVDDKDKLTAVLMVVLLAKRHNIKLDRDLIFLAEAGEESTTRVGIDFMVNQHWDEIAAEYAITEGGGGVSQEGKVRYVSISTTEKIPRGAKLMARGTAGHGSVPRQDNAVARLATAVAKIAAWTPPMRLNDTTRAYFERLATISPKEEAYRYLHLADPQKTAEIQSYLAQNELAHNSILRTSIVPTILRAGFRSNVIPSEAEATLDIRALPDEDMPKFYSEMAKVIGDANVEIVPNRGGRPASPPSRIDTEMFKAFENTTRKLYPGAITLPSMLTGATDMAQLRAKGVQCYGIGSLREDKDGTANGAHGDDERIREASLYKLVEFLWHAVMEVAASK